MQETPENESLARDWARYLMRCKGNEPSAVFGQNWETASHVTGDQIFRAVTHFGERADKILNVSITDQGAFHVFEGEKTRVVLSIALPGDEKEEGGDGLRVTVMEPLAVLKILGKEPRMRRMCALNKKGHLQRMTATIANHTTGKLSEISLAGGELYPEALTSVLATMQGAEQQTWRVPFPADGINREPAFAYSFSPSTTGTALMMNARLELRGKTSADVPLAPLPLSANGARIWDLVLAQIERVTGVPTDPSLCRYF